MVQTEFGGPVTYIRQKGYFDWADLLKSIRGWLKDEFYNVEETKHKHKPNEQEVEMSGFRKLNEYVKYYFDIKIRTENVAIVELIKDGKTVKTQEGNVCIELSARMELDWQRRFGGSEFLQSLQNFYHKYIIKQKIEQVWMGHLESKFGQFANFIKDKLQQEATP